MAEIPEGGERDGSGTERCCGGGKTAYQVDRRSLTDPPGKRSRYELGTDYLPKCQRDGQQRNHT